MADTIQHITIDSDIETRKGSYSDAVLVDVKNDTARVDFVHIDINEPDGSARGVLTNRIFMGRDALIMLRDAAESALKELDAESDDGQQ